MSGMGAAGRGRGLGLVGCPDSDWRTCRFWILNSRWMLRRGRYLIVNMDVIFLRSNMVDAMSNRLTVWPSILKQLKQLGLLVPPRRRRLARYTTIPQGVGEPRAIPDACRPFERRKQQPPARAMACRAPARRLQPYPCGAATETAGFDGLQTVYQRIVTAKGGLWAWRRQCGTLSRHW